MSKIHLKAKSSGEEPYTVSFILEDGKVKVTCDCQGAMFNTCKHRHELLRGDQTRLHDLNQSEDLDKAVEWIQATGYPHFLEEIQQAEQEKKTAEKKLKDAKKRLYTAMRTGS